MYNASPLEISLSEIFEELSSINIHEGPVPDSTPPLLLKQYSVMYVWLGRFISHTIFHFPRETFQIIEKTVLLLLALFQKYPTVSYVTSILATSLINQQSVFRSLITVLPMTSMII